MRDYLHAFQVGHDDVSRDGFEEARLTLYGSKLARVRVETLDPCGPLIHQPAHID